MKHLILFFSLLLIQQANASEILFQDGDKMAKAKARELTQKYQVDLGLKTDQTVQFEEIVSAYLIRKTRTAKLDISDNDKKVMLKQLNVQENEDMAALLTKGQYKKYLKSKIKLQP